MVDDDQASRLLRLKALLDSGAISQEEFESAKKSILDEGSFPSGSAIEGVKTKKLRFFGLLGFISLAVPWSIVYFSAEVLGYTVLGIEWQLFGLSVLNSQTTGFWHVFSSIDSIATFFSLFSMIGFLLVLTGSFLLLKRKRVGGALLLASVALWGISYAIDAQSFFYLAVPVGALLSGIVGLVSLLYRK
jgi:hypothetical protein